MGTDFGNPKSKLTTFWGAGYVLKKKFVTIPNEDPAPRRAYIFYIGQLVVNQGGNWTRAKCGYLTQKRSLLSLEFAFVIVPSASTTSSSTILSNKAPQRRVCGPNPPCTACPPTPILHTGFGVSIYIMFEFSEEVAYPGHVPKAIPLFPFLNSSVARFPSLTAGPTDAIFVVGSREIS